MFTRLTDLGFKRTATQALGFYLAYSLLGSLISGLAGLLAAAFGLVEPDDFSSLTQVGAAVIIPFCLVVAIGIGVKKGIALEFKMLIFYVITGICAVFLGALLGLVIPAYLTTLESVKTTH